MQTARVFFLALGSTLLLFLSAVKVPLLGFLLAPLVPQPLLAFGLKYGRGPAAGLTVAATLLLFVFFGSGLALGYSVLGMMALLLLVCFGRGWSIEALIGATAFAILGIGSGVLLYLFGSLSYLRDAAQAALREGLEGSLKMHEQFGFSGESAELVRKSSAEIVDFILQMTPALLFAVLAIVILVNLILLARQFPVDRSLFLSLGDLREWKSPEPLVWLFIFSGFLSLISSAWGLRTVAMNLFLASGAVYFFQGLAIVAYYFHHKNVPFFLRSLGYILIALEQLFVLLVVGLGLFDLWVDFRRLRKQDLNPNQVS
jgi:uncharacterized protein YybS (DUF2232 family)